MNIFKVLLLAIIFTSCVNTIDISGKVSNGRYTSVLTDYSCKIPKMMKPGSIIRDQSSRSGVSEVHFQDDFGIWISIVSSPIPPSISIEKIPEELPKFLSRANSTTLYREEIILDDTQIQFGVIKIEKGSNIVEIKKGGPDLIEGVFVFRKNNYVYRVSSQQPPVFDGDKYTEKSKAKLKHELLQFYRNMLFGKKS